MMTVTMKKPLFLLLFSRPYDLRQSMAQIIAGMTTAKATHSNPLPVRFGDPYMLYAKGMYYLYGTGGEVNKEFTAYSSKDYGDPEGRRAGLFSQQQK